ATVAHRDSHRVCAGGPGLRERELRAIGGSCGCRCGPGACGRVYDLGFLHYALASLHRRSLPRPRLLGGLGLLHAHGLHQQLSCGLGDRFRSPGPHLCILHGSEHAHSRRGLGRRTSPHCRAGHAISAARFSGGRFRPAAIMTLMSHQITLIPGDGIGPEVAEATVRAVEATGVKVEWDRVNAGAKALAESGQLLPHDVLASLESTRVGLKGPTATPIGGGHQSINVALRKKLDLYVNFRPVRMLPGLKTRYHDLPLDMAIFRENTEDLYSGLEHEVVPDVVESLKIITKKASMRIAQATFEYARRENRRK